MRARWKVWLAVAAVAGMAAHTSWAGSTEERSAAVEAYVMDHVANGHHWSPLPGFTVLLPGILPIHALMLLIGAGILYFLFVVRYQHDAKVPTGLTNALEAFVVYMRDEISIQFLGEEDGRKMAPLFMTFFFFILVLNLMGLVPIFATATSNINVTGSLAIITLGFMSVGAICKRGILGFFKAFVPSGVPWPLLILIVPIEFIGMFIKVMALMIRLFANMLGGHIAVFALLGLVVTYGLVGIPFLALALGTYLLEVLVAVLQAYIFTLLSAVFIGMMYHPEH
jgi:F-type H+-transporting ATPase subunit a